MRFCRVGTLKLQHLTHLIDTKPRAIAAHLLHTTAHSISTQLFRIIVHYEFIHMYLNARHMYRAPFQILLAFGYMPQSCYIHSILTTMNIFHDSTIAPMLMRICRFFSDCKNEFSATESIRIFWIFCTDQGENYYRKH